MPEIFFADFRNFEALPPNNFIESRQIEAFIENKIETTPKNETGLYEDIKNTIIAVRPSFPNSFPNKYAEMTVTSSPKFKFGQRSQLILLISSIMASILFLIGSSAMICIKRRRRRQQRRQSHFPLKNF